MWALPELVEAAARARDAELAGGALERLTQTTQPFRTDVALGLEARCRALLNDDGAADDLYREAGEIPLQARGDPARVDRVGEGPVRSPSPGGPPREQGVGRLGLSVGSLRVIGATVELDVVEDDREARLSNELLPLVVVIRQDPRGRHGAVPPGFHDHPAWLAGQRTDPAFAAVTARGRTCA